MSLPNHSRQDLPCCEEIRCLCGRLVAKLVAGGVELKCGRCHRIVLVPLEPAGADEPIPA